MDLILFKESAKHQVADGSDTFQHQVAGGSDTLQGEWTASGGCWVSYSPVRLGSIRWLVDLILSKESAKHQVADGSDTFQHQVAGGSDTLQGEWTASGGWWI